MVSAPVARDRSSGFCDERLELKAVLSSPLFQRAPKLSKILAYICEQHFTGKASDLKEYSIAVDALGRAPGFDPQADAIVRVDLHLLRKRLELFYSQDGKSRRMRIILPLGRYAPEFVPHCRAESINDAPLNCELPDHNFVEQAVVSDISVGPPVAMATGSELETPARRGTIDFPRGFVWTQRRAFFLAATFCCLFGLIIGAGGTMVFYRHRLRSLRVTQNRPEVSSAEILPHISFGNTPDFENKAIRIRCGSNRDYVDRSGLPWSMDKYYSGGTTFRRSVSQIVRSADPTLYSTGRRGVFHYDIPAAPGEYEVRLLFAETASGIEDGVRENLFDVGTDFSETLDVVSDAGGARTATTKVYSNVRPGTDGKIRISFWSSDAFLNALEIIPELNGKPGPVRISTLPHVFVDSTGKHWLSDRYFLGGRNINHTFALGHEDPPLFSRERYGSFSYAIPVAKGYSYQLTLYMAERYWGAQNSGPGGIGSRIFDVRCNGLDLVRDFDLLKAANPGTVVAVRFRHLRPDFNGKLNLDLVPVANYAVLNALEVEAE